MNHLTGQVYASCISTQDQLQSVIMLGFEYIGQEELQAIISRTKAIVAVPMWAACDMDALTGIAQKHNLILIEDSAQCFEVPTTAGRQGRSVNWEAFLSIPAKL